MKHTKDTDELAELRRLWREWVGVFERFARRRGSRHRVSNSYYKTLHEALLQECRRQYGQAAPQRQAQLHHLETLAKPWVNPNALESTRQELLLELLPRFEKEEQKLGGGRWKQFVRRLNLRNLLLAAAAVAALMFAVYLWEPLTRSSALSQLEQTILQVSYSIRRLSLLTKVGVVTLIVVLIGIRFVSMSR